MIDCFASERHYLDHLWPVACSIEGARMVCATSELRQYAQSLGGSPELLIGAPRGESGPPVLVAGYRDAGRVHKRRRLALLEHGAGQTYRGHERDPHYAGGDGWERAALILSPGPHAARRWAASHPTVPCWSLRGSPRLDPWAGAQGRFRDASIARPIKQRPVVVSFHWDSRLCPETRSAWRWWLQAVAALARERPVLGHAHPRLWRQLEPVWRRLGIAGVRDWDECLARGGLFCCDNSSAMYEWAGLGRPVLALNMPGFRRGVEHGLRFWSHVPGLQADEPDELSDAVAAALDDPPEARALRAAACEEAYGAPALDGLALARARAGIREFVLPEA